MSTPEEAIALTRWWIERAVIGLNLCPFAKSVYVNEQIRYVVSDASTIDALLADLQHELRRLITTDPNDVDTALLIHPHVLTEFLDYNDFLTVAEALVAEMDLSGVVQIASFHPAYQFAGTEATDPTNNTNRSPYPMLHLLREASVQRAVDAFADTDSIYLKNLETMRRLGASGWQALRVTPPTE